MRFLFLYLGLLVVSCGGESGGDDPSPGDLISGGVAKSDGGKSPDSECKDIDCQPDNYARSLVDPTKFVPKCESLDEFMVEDKCGYISVSLSKDGTFVVGNTSTDISLLSADLTGNTDHRPYLVSFRDRFDDENSMGYRLHIQGDEVSTNRLGMYYPDIHDGRFEYSGWETFLGTSGFDEMMFRYRLDLFGEKLDGFFAYSSLLDFCEKAFTRLESFNAYEVQPIRLTRTKEPYYRRGERICEGRVLSGTVDNSFPDQGVSEYRVRFFCDTIDKCVVTSLSFRSMKRVEP